MRVGKPFAGECGTKPRKRLATKARRARRSHEGESGSRLSRGMGALRMHFAKISNDAWAGRPCHAQECLRASFVFFVPLWLTPFFTDDGAARFPRTVAAAGEESRALLRRELVFAADFGQRF